MSPTSRPLLLAAVLLAVTGCTAEPSRIVAPDRRPGAQHGQPVALGQAGEGRLVGTRSGGGTNWTLYVDSASGPVAATEPRRPSFDSGTAPDGSHWRTWVDRYDQLLTERVVDGSRRVWRWEVAGPGEGGGADPHAPAPGTLVATRVR